MADNTTLPAGAGGDTVRGIDRLGVKTQVMQLDVGGAVLESLVTALNPLPITGAISATSLPLPVGAATAALQATINTTLGSPLQAGGTVTANQGTAAALGSAWPAELTDGTTGPVAVKAASTAAVAADKAIVVAVSPNNSVAVTGTFWQATQPVSGTVTTTPPANASTNLTQVAGTALGVPTNFGTTPGAVVAASVNSSAFVGTTAAVAASAGVQKVGISGAAGTTLDAGTAGVLDENIKNIANAAVSTAASGVQKVGISGAAAATLDAVITAATAPANGIAVLVENVTTAPSLTTGQSVMAQGDYQGSLFVKPFRRGQTVSKATTISATGATSILAAQAAGIFADLATLIISITPQATTASSFTATLSDGTASYILDFVAPVTTATPQQPWRAEFNPPLPATSAATAWTLNLSATNTVHITVVAVLQKAS